MRMPHAPGAGASGRFRATHAIGLRSQPRPVVPGEPAAGTFELARVRRTVREAGEGSGGAGRRDLPVVVVPGGPGIASVLPYAGFRRRAQRRGIDTLMVEHRGVGLSRRGPDGSALPLEAMRVEYVVDDLRAALDAEGVDRAVICGSSYGTYVALAFAATHPERTAALVLDSPMLSAGDEPWIREYSRDLLWRGTLGDDDTRALAARVRALLAAGAEPLRLGRELGAVYSLGGVGAADDYLAQVERGCTAVSGILLGALSDESIQDVPFVSESHPVGEIGFRQLDFGLAGDGLIFDLSDTLTEQAARFSPYAGEPYDLRAALPDLTMPVVVLSGDRDLVTPRPLAEEIVAATPRSFLVPLADHGHDALDARPSALLDVLAAVVADDCAALDRAALTQAAETSRASGLTRFLGSAVRGAVAVDRRVPIPSRRPATPGARRSPG